jgi:hypothetical protein
LIIRGAASQSADLMQVQDSAATVLFRITSAGRPQVNARMGIAPAGATSNFNASLVVADVTGGANNIQEWQNSSGTMLSRVDVNGFVHAGAVRVKSGANSSITGAQISVEPQSASTIGALIRGAASQTANLQEWQSSDLLVQGAIDNAGNAFLGRLRLHNGTRAVDTNAVRLLVETYAAQVSIVAKGAVSQTANLQEWQDSAAGLLARVSSNGVIETNQYLNMQTSGNAGIAVSGTYRIRMTGNNSQFESATPAVATIVTKLIANQTADALNYQSSASVVLGGRNANAQIYTGSTTPLTTAVGGATTSASGAGGYATITTTSAHNLAVGDRITVAGITPTGYNGTYIVTGVSTNAISYVNATTGGQTVAGTVSVDAQASIVTRSAATAGLIVRGVTGQSSSLFQVQNVNATGLLSVDAFGFLQAVSASFGTNSGFNSLLMRLRPQSSVQLADQMQYQNSAGTVLGGRNAVSQIYTGTTAGLNTNTGGATTAAAGDGTTATITTTSNHNLAVGDLITVAGVTPTGYNGTYVLTGVTATTVSYANATTGSQTVAGTVAAPAQVSVTSRSAGTMPLYVNAPTGQSAVLTKWAINQSTVAQVTSVGNVQSVGFQSLPNAYLNMTEENAGGRITMTRATSAAANPGANLAKIYFRDGTVPGTLKLVVRAGTAGAETTILDNIPQ